MENKRELFYFLWFRKDDDDIPFDVLTILKEDLCEAKI